MLRNLCLLSFICLVASCSGGGSEADAPGTPPQTQSNSAPVITTSQISADVDADLNTSISVSDPDGDTVTLSKVSGPGWLTLTTTGAISGKPALSDRGRAELVVDASDGALNTTATITIQVNFDAVEHALRTGDYTLITEESNIAMEDVLLDTADPSLSQHRKDIETLYQLGPGGTFEETSLAPVWAPPSLRLVPDAYQQSANLRWNPEFNSPAMRLRDGRAFGVMGRDESGARYLALGGNPTMDPRANRVFSDGNDMDLFVRNAIRWLAKDDSAPVLNIAISPIPKIESKMSDPEVSVRQWLDGAFGQSVSYNAIGTCKNSIVSCLSEDTDLIIVFRDAYKFHVVDGARVSHNAITAAHENGAGILYIFNEALLSPYADVLLERLKISPGGLLNRDDGDRVDGESSVRATYDYAETGHSTIKSMVSRIAGDHVEHDFTTCAGPLACEENPEISTEIASLRKAIDTILETTRHTDPFKNEDTTRFQRALLLLGDYYRANTVYPMPKETTSAADVFAALIGEFAVVLRRDSTPAQPNLGVFASSVDGLPALENETVSLTSRKTFTASGLYAAPGETVTVTRTDESAARTWIQIHALEAGHYEPFRTEAGTNFERPIHVTSERVEVTTGVSVTITSPYGGPIQIVSDQHDEELSFSFSNVARHPFWNGQEDNDSFLVDIANSTLPWVEMATPNYVVHTTADKMREMLNTPPYVNNPGRLADDYEKYLGNWPLWFEGYQGPGITSNPDLNAHDIAKQFENEIDQVRHLIAAPSMCEPACPGPIQHVEGTIAPLAWENQAAVAAEMHTHLTPDTNNDSTPMRSFGPPEAIAHLSFIHSNYRRYLETGSLIETCPAVPHQGVFELLQSAQTALDPAATIRGQTRFSSLELNTVRYIQLTAALQAQGAFEDGWEVWPRVNAYERRYARNGRSWKVILQKIPYALISDGKQLGYGGRQAEDVYPNTNFDDWMLVALSWTTKRDLTDYLTQLWGLETTAYGRGIVAAYGYERLEPRYYALSSSGHCTDLNAAALPIDGTTPWPE